MDTHSGSPPDDKPSYQYIPHWGLVLHIGVGLHTIPMCTTTTQGGILLTRVLLRYINSELIQRKMFELVLGYELPQIRKIFTFKVITQLSDILTTLHSEDEDQFIAGVHSQRTCKKN